MARILVVDDENDMLNLEKTILSDRGHEVLVTTDALYALDLLKLYRMDLIIVDIFMPRYDGFQFVRTIRNNSYIQRTPIAFLSASSEKNDVAKAVELGADFYLIKPIEKENYLAKIDSFFERHYPAPQPRIDFNKPKLEKMKIQLPVSVLSVSDLGVEILSRRPLMDGDIVELPSSLFNETFPYDPQLRVSWTKNHSEGVTRAFLTFTDHHIESVRKIQRHLRARREIAAMHFYPKWR